MIWSIKPCPKTGEWRTVKRFAWLPYDLNATTRIWLETYFVRQQYVFTWDGAKWITARAWLPNEATE